MTDKALLIAALRQCAEKLERDERERLFQTLDRKMADQQAAEAVREYRLLADLMEGKPDATEDLLAACKQMSEQHAMLRSRCNCMLCEAVRKADGQ